MKTQLEGKIVLLSMTGFSSKSISLRLPKLGKISLSIEMKAVNSRFFEVVCKLPNALSCLEIKIVNQLQKKLLRGRAYLTIRFAEDNEAFEEVRPSLKLVEGYLAASQKIKKLYKIKGDLSIQDFFQLPNIFVAGKETLTSDEEKIVLNAVMDAADQLMATRQEEGDSLGIDLQKRFVLCDEKIKEIKKQFDRLMKSLKQEIDSKLAIVENGDDVIKGQLEDLYVTLNKIDIHEEITRFKSHLKSSNALLKNKQIDKGRRFDFILQELLREINTIMAKCSSYDISSVGVDIKVELEKAREQVQNIL